MPTDVERLFRIIAPALVLLAGCDEKEEATKVEVVAKAPMDLGGVEVDPPKVEPPPDVGTPDADPDLPLAEKIDLGTSAVDPIPEVIPTPESGLMGTAKLGRRMPTCPSGTWCTDKASAKKNAVRGAKYRRGCPDRITLGAKGLDGPLPGDQIRGFDEAKTKARRAEGKKNACCYAWYSHCPGGRALLDAAGTPVVASFETGLAPGWSSEREPLLASSEARAFAARAWLDDAAMEHASVASFGRVALELLSLGAPPELIEGAHLAALDEIRHAKTCLSLARACGAGELEPGRLAAVPQRSADFARFAADTFIEGCVGETVAALVVTRAAAGVEDPSLRRALEEIAADEARHAALAWRMVSWAIARGGAPVLAAVHEAAERLRPAASESPSATFEPDGIDQLGRLSGRELTVARHDAWTGIIEPMLSTLPGPSVAAQQAARKTSARVRESDTACRRV